MVSFLQVFPPKAVNAIRFAHLCATCLAHRIISLRCMHLTRTSIVAYSIIHMLCICVAIPGRNSGKELFEIR